MIKAKYVNTRTNEAAITEQKCWFILQRREINSNLLHFASFASVLVQDLHNKGWLVIDLTDLPFPKTTVCNSNKKRLEGTRITQLMMVSQFSLYESGSNRLSGITEREL
jgi:hypothetical protein